MPELFKDPKPSGFRGQDSTSKADAAPSGGGLFGSGCGWVVVAFIGPAGVNVSDLAGRILNGSESPSSRPTSTPLGALAQRALQQKRKQEAEREKLATPPRTYTPERPTVRKRAGTS